MTVETFLSETTPVRQPMARLRRVRWSGMVVWLVLLFLIIIPVSTFVLVAISPRLFRQGTSYLTFSNVTAAFQGYTGQGIVDSLLVATLVGLFAVTFATIIAWTVQRTNVYGRRFWSGAMWLLLLVPTWMTTLGWIDVISPGELLSALGVHTLFFFHMFFGASGIVFVLTTAALPFSYFVISVGMRGLGSEFEDAARVHGAGRLLTVRTVLPIIAPALLSAFAISFAEAMSDFGVAFTLGSSSHFPIATYTLFNAIYAYPANFPVAAVIAAVLILSTVPPVFLQARVMRGRSYAVLSGRTKAVRRYQFSPLARVGVTLALGVFMFFVLGLPLLGAITSSFTNTASFITTTGVHWTLQSYKDVFQPLPSFTTLGPPLWTSNQLGIWVASGTLILAYVLARRMASRTPGIGQRVTDVFLLGSIAIPGIVLGVGYIFFYDQHFITSHIVDLYETMPLLIMGLIASSVPSQARLLTGPVGQIQLSLSEAARVHGASKWRAFRSTSLPLLSRALVWAWLLTFTKTISELAIAQILYQPGHEPASVVIETYLGTIFAAIGSAATVITLVEMVGVIAIVLLIFRLVTPKGWRRVGEAGAAS
jgi:iron(III) transport system permease protein